MVYFYQIYVSLMLTYLGNGRNEMRLKAKKKYLWLIIAVVLSASALTLLIYAVSTHVINNNSKTDMERIRDIAYGTQRETSDTHEENSGNQTENGKPQTGGSESEESKDNSESGSAPGETKAIPSDTTPPQSVPESTSKPGDDSTAPRPDSSNSAPATTSPQITLPPETQSATSAAGETTTLPQKVEKPLSNGGNIDFEALRKENSDIYAWISIPDTTVEYPVLQNATDNEYYLKHDIYGNETYSASIFTENYNSKDFSDFITIIYGHTMKNGTMFAPLLNYRDSEYFEENRFIYVYTPEKTFTYKIFAAYKWDDRHILLNYDFTNSIIRTAYINYIMSIRDMNSNIASDVEVTKDDKILTLSCCTYADGERFIVQGVLIGEE